MSDLPLRFAIVVAGEHHAVVYERSWRSEAENLGQRCAGLSPHVLIRDIAAADHPIIREWKNGQLMPPPAAKWR